MSTLRSLVTSSAVSALFLSCAAPQQDDVARWAPACGEQVEWHWCRLQTHELVPTGTTILQAGSEVRQLHTGEERHHVQDSFELRVVDRIVARDEHTPSQLERFVLHARRTTCSEWGNYRWLDELVTTSLYEEALLMFVRDAARDLPFVQFAASPRVPVGHMDETVLAGLDEQLDLRALLGGAPRRPGEAWALVTEDLLTLVRPGGELEFFASELGPDAGDSGVLTGWMLGVAPVSELRRAEGRAVYERLETRVGARVACIALSGTIETGGSLCAELEHMGNRSAAVDRELKPFLDLEPAVEHTIRFEGELLWNLDAHRAHRLEIEGESKSRVSLTSGMWGGELELVDEWRGELHLRVTAATVE